MAEREGLAARKEKLARWLRARNNQPGYKANVEEIRKELARIDEMMAELDAG